MILSGGKMSRLPLATAIAMTLLCGWSMVMPASACGPEQPCDADAIDGFFLPLITGSLGEPSRIAVMPLLPATTPAPSPLTPSGEPVIIRPPAPPAAPDLPKPDKPQPSTEIVNPVQQLLIGQQLITGPMHEGADVDLYFDLLPSIHGGPNGLTDQLSLSDLALVPDAFDHTMLLMEQTVTVPTVDFWPLQTALSQQVDMQVTCGACGPGGGLSRFDGTGRLEIQNNSWGSGKITDIDLLASGGSTAKGEMDFTLQAGLQNVFADDNAHLRLVINHEMVDLATRLVAWRGARQQITGLFVGMPEGGDIDPGGIAGQFRGGECVTACGVEN
jgi:hypothetical protein